tara:strand:- start:760 stop:1101 length:342 start_codon:yes stop_codon:yes gene_type:complete
MGINSTDTAYGFGQLGSGFCDTTGAFTPPTGKVIVAIQFLAETTLSGLVADTAQGNDVAFFSHTTPVTGNGGGADATDASQKFPKGLTIYGRWTSVTLNSADADGGIICYFGE